MRKFKTILEDMSYDDVDKALLSSYTNTHNKQAFNKYLRRKKIIGVSPYKKTYVPWVYGTPIYREIFVKAEDLVRVLPDFDKDTSYYNIGRAKWRSWSKELIAAQAAAQNGDFKFRLRYIPKQGDKILDLTMLPEYEDLKYATEREVLCKPSGKVQIIYRNFEDIERQLWCDRSFSTLYRNWPQVSARVLKRIYNIVIKEKFKE